MMSNLVDELPWMVLLSFFSKTQKKNSDSRQHPHIYLWVSISRPVSLSLGLQPLLLAFELHMTCNFHMLVYHKWKKKINKRKSKWIHRASIMIMCKLHKPMSQLEEEKSFSRSYYMTLGHLLKCPANAALLLSIRNWSTHVSGPIYDYLLLAYRFSTSALYSSI